MASYALQLVVPPTVDPVSLAEAKLHLRVDGDEEDTLIASMIRAATEYAEGFTGRAIATAGYRLTLDGPPIGRIGAPRLHPEVEIPVQFGQGVCSVTLTRNGLRLPLPPLQRVDAVRYIDPAGAAQEMAASDYAVDTASEPGRVVMLRGWPALATDRPGVVSVDFTAGYAAGHTPAAIRHGILLHVGYLYANREPVTGYVGGFVQWAAIDNLYALHRVFT